jgi:hypothetical protein
MPRSKKSPHPLRAIPDGAFRADVLAGHAARPRSIPPHAPDVAAWTGRDAAMGFGSGLIRCSLPCHPAAEPDL